MTAAMEFLSHLLMRAALWARRPPSKAAAAAMAGAVALALAILAAEHFGLWPDWAAVSPQGRRPPIPPDPR